MKCFSSLWFVRALALGAALAFGAQAFAQTDPLPSWNDGAAKKAIVEFVQATTTQGSPKFVPPAERIATFDQDGTLWVEHPMYSQVMYILESVPALVKAKPELAKVAPFSTVLEILKGNRAAISRLTMPDLEKLAVATLTGMPVETFQAAAKKWLAEAKDPRWKRPFTDLTYLPMQEVLKYLRANGYKTFIVTGGGQDFVRVYSEAIYGIPPEQVVGSAGATTYGYAKDGKPFLTKAPKLLLNDDKAGKPEGIHLMIGRRPVMAFGNSDRRPADARIHDGRRRRAAVAARIARRCEARIRLRPGAGAARDQDRRVHAGAARPGEEAGLDRHQHEGRLEADLRVRVTGARRSVGDPASCWSTVSRRRKCRWLRASGSLLIRRSGDAVIPVPVRATAQRRSMVGLHGPARRVPTRLSP